MRITKVKLDNYVCFYDAPEFELGPGINFVVGKNNSGKTALLYALSFDKKRRAAHRSEETLSPRNRNPEAKVDVEIEVLLNPGELFGILSEYGDNHYMYRSQILHFHPDSVIDDTIPMLPVLIMEENKLRLRYIPNRIELGNCTTEFAVLPEDKSLYLDVNLNLDGRRNPQSPRNEHAGTVWEILWSRIAFSAFKFDAQRQINDQSSTRNSLNLNYDGSNLAQVMDTARRKRTHRHDRLIELVKFVFPDIREIVIEKHEREQITDVDEREYLEVYIGYNDPQDEYYDLRVALSDCGSGIAQVMAMLYVVAVSDDSRVIMIDEPQSFLHPDALRRLLQILQLEDFSHHQYIIATHSAIALSAVRKKTVLHIERKGTRSTVSEIGPDDNAALVELLRSVGYRLSDVFGTDALFWVEGPTEVQCFPLLLEQHGLDANRCRFIPLGGGGYLTEKRAKRFEDLYGKVARTIGLLPAETMIVHDADIAPNIEDEESSREVELTPLPRQNFESYLIVPEILADLLKQYGAEDMQEHSEESLAEWIRENNNGRDYDDPDWLREVDGAKFLDKLFNCKGGISYNDKKVAYGVEITKRILERDESAAHFQEIVDILKPLLNPDQSEDEPAQT